MSERYQIAELVAQRIFHIEAILGGLGITGRIGRTLRLLLVEGETISSASVAIEPPGELIALGRSDDQ
jgi:hypothetical protein